MSQFSLVCLLSLDPYESCFLKGKNLDGHISSVHQDNVKSAIECQAICKEKKQCQSFVYSIDGKQCWFKERKVEDSVITEYNDGIVGPKYCSK